MMSTVDSGLPRDKPFVDRTPYSIRDGQFKFDIHRIHYGSTEYGSWLSKKVATGAFCIFDVTVTNVGGGLRTMKPANQHAFAGSVQHQPLAPFSERQKALLSQLTAGQSASGHLVFDLPKGMWLDRVEFHDSVMSGGATVRLKRPDPAPETEDAPMSPVTIRRRTLLIAVSAVVLIGGTIAGMVNSGESSEPGFVSRDDFGSDWPLTVDQGTLDCTEGPQVGGAGLDAVTFTAPGGTTYAVNGAAKTVTNYPEIDPIWASDPSGTSPKMGIGPLIDKGLELCN